MKRRVNYYVDSKSRGVKYAAAFFAVSMALRVVWCLVWKEDLGSPYLFFSRGLLPVFSCGAFLLCIFRFGKDKLWLSFFPAFLGVLFFILKAADFVWWHQALCTVLYLAVAALYGMAVFGVAPVRKLLIPIFALPLAFHVFIEDMIINRRVYDAAGWVQEISVLCIMAGLLCLSIEMKER